jgi:hypothetical protein
MEINFDLIKLLVEIIELLCYRNFDFNLQNPYSDKQSKIEILTYFDKKISFLVVVHYCLEEI